MEFTSDPIRNELFPNLKWLPSRSADPREEHIAFYGLILPKTHPFWLENQPGQLWNCKCDWEETDEPAAPSAPKSIKPAQGLEGNPAITGEIFTENAAYISILPNRQQKTVKTELLKIYINKAQRLLDIKLKRDGLNISFSVNSVNEFLNQPNKLYLIKNELFLQIDNVLNSKTTVYLGVLNKKDLTERFISHLYQIKLINTEMWLVVRVYDNNDCVLYSISDSKNILKHLNK